MGMNISILRCVYICVGYKFNVVGIYEVKRSFGLIERRNDCERNW